MLLLSGPAGTGKTTTIRLLAEEMGMDLVEWSEEVEEWSIGPGIGEFARHGWLRYIS